MSGNNITISAFPISGDARPAHYPIKVIASDGFEIGYIHYNVTVILNEIPVIDNLVLNINKLAGMSINITSFRRTTIYSKY